MSNLSYRLTLKFVLSVAGIILIGAFPDLFSGVQLDFSGYFLSLESLFSSIIHPNGLDYIISGVKRPLFPKILEPWSYSIILLFSAFFIAFAVSLATTYFTMLLSEKTRDKIKFVLFSLESVPDVLIIEIFTLIVIGLYKETGFLFLNIATYGAAKAYTLPIIVLAVLPTILLYRTMILGFEEETNQPYVDLARSKGLGIHHLLVSHIFRNALIHIFQHSKFTIWFMLSNLLVVEYIFNIHGLLYFMFMQNSAEVFTIGLFLLFLPIFVLFSIGQVFIERIIGRDAEI